MYFVIAWQKKIFIFGRQVGKNAIYVECRYLMCCRRGVFFIVSVRGRTKKRKYIDLYKDWAGCKYSIDRCYLVEIDNKPLSFY